MHPFRQLEWAIDRLLPAHGTVLEIGCGRNAPMLTKIKGKADQLIGIDLVEFTNPDPELTLIPGDACHMTAIADRSVDLIFSRSVMEHIQDVHACYREVARVLKPGGCYIFLTPNFFDYISLIAWIVPNRLHPMLVRATEGRAEEDTFPTFYRSNTRRAIRDAANRNGLMIDDFGYLGQYPASMMFSETLFRIMARYEKFLEWSGAHFLQGWIICTLRPKDAAFDRR